MILDQILKKIDRLRENIEQSVLPTVSLLRVSNHLRLDWGFERDENFSDDYNEGATQPILIKGLSSDSHPINAKRLGSSNNKIITSLVDGFIRNNLLTKERLTETHRLIIRDGGTYRTTAVKTNTSSSQKFTFSKPENISDDIENLVRWYNSKKDNHQYHPLFLAAEFHYRLVITHPYNDGNGRLARIISSMILLRNKLPPPTFLSDERKLYINRLKNADTGDLEGWLQLVGEKVIVSQELLIKEMK